MSEWPRPGRCGACLQRAEQFPSQRWRHLDGPCRFRSVGFVRVDQLPLPEAVFVADGEELPQPTRWHTTVHYEGGVPTSVGIHSPGQVAEFWAGVRAALSACSPRLAAHEPRALRSPVPIPVPVTPPGGCQAGSGQHSPSSDPNRAVPTTAADAHNCWNETEETSA